MAVNTELRKLTEEELNNPDFDDEGNLDVESYLLPDAGDIEDPYLAEAWEAALEELEVEEPAAEEAEPPDDQTLK